jgi:heterodisulfide reductase subunit D
VLFRQSQCNIYEAPRELIQKLDSELVEMKRSRANGLCCGAGGAQMFKDAESGNKEVNIKEPKTLLKHNLILLLLVVRFVIP